MSKPILEIQKVTKKFGGLQALQDVDVRVEYNEKVGLIGPNGAGKTTLLNIISGILKCDKGKVIFDGRDITGLDPHKRVRLGIARTFQVPRPLMSMTVLENVTVPLLFTQRSSIHNYNEIALNILQMVGLESHAHLLPSQLTQIELRRLELARALAVRPKLLLLDEVGSGLTIGEIDELVTFLKKLSEKGLTIIMVEHVMRAIFSFCERVVVLNFGTKIADGKPREISSDEKVVKVYLGE
jgi:branched-chain amino acid transport system ATP-binding protein